MNIYVGNLNYQVDEDDLQGVFEAYGSVSDVKIIQDKMTGRSKGFGFVTMNDEEEGQKALEALNGATLENRQMVVNEAREKSDSNNRSNFRKRY